MIARLRRAAGLGVGQWRTVAWFVVGGVLLGVLWRVLLPVTVKLGDGDETRAGVDSTLAVLGLLAGALTAVRVLVRPAGRRLGPAGRSGLAVLGSLAGGLVAWPVGDLIGRPGLTAPGVVLAWPIGTCLGLFVAAMLPATARRLNATPPPPA